MALVEIETTTRIQLEGPTSKYLIYNLLPNKLADIGFSLYQKTVGDNFNPSLEFDLQPEIWSDKNALSSVFLRHLEENTENWKPKSTLTKLLLKDFVPQKMLLELNSQKVIDPEADPWQILNGLEEFRKLSTI